MDPLPGSPTSVSRPATLQRRCAPALHLFSKPLLRARVTVHAADRLRHLPFSLLDGWFDKLDIQALFSSNKAPLFLYHVYCRRLISRRMVITPISICTRPISALDDALMTPPGNINSIAIIITLLATRKLMSGFFVKDGLRSTPDPASYRFDWLVNTGFGDVITSIIAAPHTSVCAALSLS